MRIESAVRSISWIPSEAIPGVMRLPFDIGPMHYDDPPPDRIDHLAALAGSGAVRFINELRGWVEVENGLIVDQGQVVDYEWSPDSKWICYARQDGSFASKWMDEYKSGLPKYKEYVKADAEHKLETTGKELRKMMSWVNDER